MVSYRHARSRRQILGHGRRANRRRYEADLIVGNRLIIELKHCDKLAPVHVAQLINYLCTTGIEHGLLINFGSPKFEIVKRIFSKRSPQGEALL